VRFSTSFSPQMIRLPTAAESSTRAFTQYAPPSRPGGNRGTAVPGGNPNAVSNHERSGDGANFRPFGDEQVDGRLLVAALLFGRHRHRSPQASLPDRAESRSLVESAAWATLEQRALSAADFCSGPIVSSEAASTWSDACSDSAQSREGRDSLQMPDAQQEHVRRGG
jgi:hypothetical protein